MKTTKITVKRPEGNIEIVDVSANFPAGLTDVMFEKMKAATKAAGRGDMISYSVVQDAPTATEMAEIEEENRKVRAMKRTGFTDSDF